MLENCRVSRYSNPFQIPLGMKWLLPWMILKYHGSIGSWASVPGCRQCRQCKHAVKLNQYEQLVNRMRISNSKKYDTGMCILYIYICEQVCDYMWTCGNILCCIIPRYAHGSRITCFKRPISACCPHSKNELVYTVEKPPNKRGEKLFQNGTDDIYISRPRFPFLKILGLLSYRASRKEVTNHLTYLVNFGDTWIGHL